MLICIITLFCAAGADAAGALPTIRSVDFYPSGAKFTLRVESDGNFAFELPGAFSGDSVRCLTLEGLTSLKVDSSAVKEQSPVELLPLKKKIDDAAREVGLIDGRSAALTQALTMLVAPSGAGGEKKSAPYSGTLSDYLEYVANARKMEMEIRTELVEVGMSLQKARETLKERSEEYEIIRLDIERRKPSGSGVVVKVLGTTSAPASLLFEAFTSSAGWNVGYEMGMDSALGDIEAVMSAAVWQKTGLDVDGSFSFHTRQPSFSVSPPEVNPLIVNLTLPLDYRTNDKLMMEESYLGVTASQNIPGYSPPGGNDVYEPHTPLPEAISTLSNVSVRGDGKIDGDGNQARIKLGVMNLKSVPVIISVPEQNREAWIVASVDAIPPSFLPGTAELSVDGASTGRTNIPGAVGSMRIPFGMTALVTAKKEPYVTATGSSWTGKGILNDGYTLEISSGMLSEQEIIVLDRIPIPTADKIVLDVKKIDPEPAERDKENRLTWRLNLKPGETQKIIVDYTLTYPGDATLHFSR
ncbi:MAG: DUF4139 domain-containing protein [Synergistaceae bacterium]|nr:DUF4139 domain-containing protein [Synergistaceae bacterium]